MVPHPAVLSHTARSWPANEVFWVIRNGVKMSGMPAWAYRLSDDEMWAITAFTMQLPRLAPIEYEALVREVDPRSRPRATPDARGADARDADARAVEAARAEASRAARRVALEFARPSGAAREFGFVASAARSRPPATAPGLAPSGDPGRGQVAIYQYACTACHQIPGTERAGSAPVGPPLDRIGTRAVIAGVMPNTPANMVRWLRAPREVAPRSAMPDLGVTERDARDIAAYLYTLR
jgi:mono/diheme cytochrome c family protein